VEQAIMAELKTCVACGSTIAATITERCPVCSGCPDHVEPVEDPETAEPAPATLVEIAVAGTRVPLKAEEGLLLGRGSASPVAAALARFDNVSRRHATISVLPTGSVEVCDLESTNGTFVGDLQLTPREAVELVLPTTIRLARFCFVDLRAVP
jgi:hypothetical protein